MSFGHRLAEYAKHPDPAVAACNRIALLVATSQPTYPLYLWWLVGGPWWLACWTFLSTPFFASVPWVARRHGLVGESSFGLAGPALLVLAGFGNGLLATKALGAGSGVELFLIPEALIALLALGGPGRSRRSRWLATALVAGALVTLALGRRLGPAFGAFTAEQTAQMARINAGSVAVLTLVVLWSLGPLAFARAYAVQARRWRAALSLLGQAVFALLAWLAGLVIVGLENVVEDPIVRKASVSVPALPPGQAPIRVALLSDIHIGNRAMDAARLARIVGQVNAQRPDVVLMAGDFVTGSESPAIRARAEQLTAPLSGLHAPLGVFAVLGNHDHWTEPDAIRAELEKAGVTVLVNEAARRGPLAIVGIDDPYTGHDDVGRAMASGNRIGGIPIAFAHSPDIARKLPGTVPLLLAGHTHCGQVVTPWGTSVALYVTRRHLFDPRYGCGRVDDPGRTTFVTAGVGSGSVPVRINAMTDWWLIELRR